MLDNYKHDVIAESFQRERDVKNELTNHVETIKWLVELLSHNRVINMHDGLGTFIHKTTDGWRNGWRICGKDDIIAPLNERVFCDLFTTLIVARSLKKNFDEGNKKCKN